MIHFTIVYSSAFTFKYNSVARQIILTKGKYKSIQQRGFIDTVKETVNIGKNKTNIFGKYLSSKFPISAFHEIFGQKGELDFQTNICASINYEQCQKETTIRFSDLFLSKQNLLKSSQNYKKNKNLVKIKCLLVHSTDLI